MLLQIRHLGTKDRARLYAIQTASGLSGVLALSAAHVDYGKPDRIEIALAGTGYTREYAVTGVPGDPPRIRDLDQGYDALHSFVATWEHATEEQRADLCEYDGDVLDHRWIADMVKPPVIRTIRKRGKWSFRKPEDRPRLVPAVPVGAGWLRLSILDLRAALKGTRQAVRIGSATIKPAVLRDLCGLWGPEIELCDGDGALCWRSVDSGQRDGMATVGHRAQATIRHGAGDPYAGRNGFEARIVLQAA